MSYKILHFSDLHLDASFAGQGFPVEFGKERRLHLRSTLTGILAKAREFKVNAITIGGDLFVQEYLLPETADFIQQQFALLAPIKVIIAPGGQDPYTNESTYARLNWSENVHIFRQSKLDCLELTPDIHLWGACNPPTRGQSLLDGFQLARGINILLLHALINLGNNDVHTIASEAVRKAGFHCALFGGDHQGKSLVLDKTFLVNPGSPEPLAPSEDRDLHQISVIDIDGETVRIQPLSLQQWHYKSVEVNLTSCTSKAEAAHKIDKAVEDVLSNAERSGITISLVGRPRFDLNILSLSQLLQTSAMYRLETNFGLGFDVEQLAREQTVRGFLVQGFLDRINKSTEESERNRLLTALNFALQALEGKQVSLYETKKY